MSNLLKTELYKLFHSWYFWEIGIFNLLLSSILLLDSKERSSNLIMASLYNIPLLYFLSIVFIALFIGSDFSGNFIAKGLFDKLLLVCRFFMEFYFIFHCR